MKKILLGVAAMAMLFASCKKKDSGGSAGGNTFSIGSNTFTAINVSANGSDLTAINPGGSVVVTFDGSTLPTTGGTYRVVSFSPSANEINVSAAIGVPSGTVGYISTGNDNISATVTVSGGKVSVNLPKVWARNIFSIDSVQVSGNFTQY